MEAVVLASFDEARAHGHTWVGAEHLLLALTKQPSGSPVREALNACGVSEGSVAEAVRERTSEAGERKGISPNPRFYGIEGRAEGLALRAGKASPAAEEFLLALIWEPNGAHAFLFNDLGVSAADLQAALAEQGVAVPDAEPPPFDARRWGERVPILREEYDEGLPGRIARLLPAGTLFGCNARGDEAWVVAGEGFELAPYIDQARQASETQ